MPSWRSLIFEVKSTGSELAFLCALRLGLGLQTSLEDFELLRKTPHFFWNLWKWSCRLQKSQHSRDKNLKVQLTPQIFLPLMKTTSFLYYFSEKSILIDKIPPILQAFKVVISCPMTKHGGIWVGPLLMSSKDIAQNTQETFDGVSSAVKTYLDYLCVIFCRKWTRLPNERSVSSSNTIWSLSTISTAPMYIYIFDFEVRVASRVRHTASHDRQFVALLAWKSQNHGWTNEGL